MVKFDCVERPVSRFFYAYGRFVARNVWPMLLFPIFITVALTFGILNFDVVRGATSERAHTHKRRQTTPNICTHPLTPCQNMSVR
jgi:hypothetical protein